MTENESWLLWEQVARAVHRHLFARSQGILAPVVEPQSPLLQAGAAAAAPTHAAAPAGEPAPGPRRVRVRGHEMRSADRVRRMALMQTGLQLLARRKRGLSRDQVMAGLRKAMPPLPYEQGVTPGAKVNRYVKKCDWIMNIPVSCGWMTKSRGHWQITATGSDALQRTATPQELMKLAHSHLGAEDPQCVMSVRAERRERGRQAQQTQLHIAAAAGMP